MFHKDLKPRPGENLLISDSARSILPALTADVLESFENHVVVTERDGEIAFARLRRHWCEQLWDRSCSSAEGRTTKPCQEFSVSLARRCMAEGKAVQQRCPAGLQVFAVPIEFHGEAEGHAGCILGSLVLGKDLDADAVARRYGMDSETLKGTMPRVVEASEGPRLELRLGTIARVLGLLVELRMAQKDNETLSLFPATNPNPVLRFDARGSLIFANEAAAPILPVLLDEDGILRSPWLEEMTESLREEANRHHELATEERVFDLSFAPLGRKGPVNVYGLDVTKRHRAETERLRLEKQVQHAQKLESLGVLAGGIAHDFNNLLVGILGNADLALEELPSSSLASPYLEDILVAAKRAADLCRQMLAYSGKGRFVVEAIDLNEIIVEMSHLLEISISKKAIIKLDLAESLPLIEADATQLRQLIMNLVTNASEAIGNRSGIIGIRTGAIECVQQYIDDSTIASEVGDGPFVFVEVSDTGCGMDEATRKRIFEPFFTTKFTGRGLGLSALLGIVRGHKGVIRVYSEPRQGTTMKILFPVLATEASLPLAVEGEKNDYRSSGIILLVDDEETVRVVGRRMLERVGFKVKTASDGREALAYLKDHASEIRLIVLDLTMPHLDGEETLRSLRHLGSDIPVLLSSGYNEQDIVQRFAGRKYAAFIQKPYRQQEFLACIRKILGEEPPSS